MTKLQMMLPVLVPMVIAVLKALVPKVPKLWLPVLAPVLGAGIELMASGAFTVDTAWAAVLGSAGVGLREVLDQVRKAMTPEEPPNIKSTILYSIYGAMVLGLLGGAGCATKLAPGGAYTDPVLYRADQAITSGYSMIHAFVQWESDNREVLKAAPEIKSSADEIRKKAPGMFKSVLAARDMYAARPTGANRITLEEMLGMLQATLTEVVKVMATKGI